MENKDNIDELIRNGMEDFHPQAPDDVWQGIEQQLQAPSVPAGNTLIQKVLELGWQMKLAALIIVPAAITGLYFLVQTEPKQLDLPQTESPVYNESATLDRIEVLAQENLPMVTTPAENKDKATQVSKEFDVVSPIVEPSTTEKLSSPVAHEAPVAKENKPEKTETEKTPPVSPPILPTYKAENNPETPPNAQKHNDPEFGNFFSPNGDGSNDVWEIRIDPTVFYHLKVVNTKGQLVFETEKPGDFWNGVEFKTGVECENGTYSYIFDYQFDKNGVILSKKGFINLMR